MSISPASWLSKAQALPLGGRARVDHDCGPGRTLTIRHDETGLHAFCFRCNDKGWAPPAPVSLEVRLKRLSAMTEADERTAASTELPEPRLYNWADWPEPCRIWLLKAGLSRADSGRLGAYYHPPTNRVVLPVIDPLLGVVFWQARAVDGRQPKYMAPAVGKGHAIPRYGSAPDVTLTEDILSAYKVGLVGEGWALIGTSLSRWHLSELLKRNAKVNVWLDPDRPGQKAATKVLATLRATGITARNILSHVDPKLIHLTDMKELLCSK